MAYDRMEAEEIYSGILDMTEDEIVERLQNIIYDPNENNEILIWLILLLVSKVKSLHTSNERRPTPSTPREGQ